MYALGRHILLELNNCNREVLNDIDQLRKILISAARESGATILGESFHHFQPQGVSGVVVIAESHISIHTWPEYGYAAVDIFTCGDRVEADKASEDIIKGLQVKSPTSIEIKRGIMGL